MQYLIDLCYIENQWVIRSPLGLALFVEGNLCRLDKGRSPDTKKWV
jgi:hypothetical protein